MLDVKLQEQLLELNKKYGFSEETLRKWYRKLISHPEVLPGQIYDCLDMLCEKRTLYYKSLENIGKIDYSLLTLNDLDTDIMITIETICGPNKVLKLRKQ